MPLQAPLLAGLNHLLASANWARARLAAFAGRSAVIDMPPLRLALVVDATGLFAAGAKGGEYATPDVTIRLPADTPLRLPQGLDTVMAAAHVEGNAEFATELSFVFRNLRWDAEEDLARIVGDIAAHRIVRTADRLVAWQKEAATRLAENLSEYLRHESRLLVSTDEFAAFRDEVVRLNVALAALENRIKA